MQRLTARYYVERKNLNWKSHQNLGTELRNSPEQKVKILQEPKGIEDTRRTRPSVSTKQGAYEFTETEAASTVSTWVCTRFSTYMYVISISLVFLWDS